MNDVREATDAPSVPYDKKDMETFSQINNLERIKNEVLTMLVLKYCRSSNACGQPYLNHSSVFDIRNLERGTALPWDTVENYKSLIFRVGIHCRPSVWYIFHI